MPIGGILKVVSESIKYLHLLLKTSHVRKLRKAVDAGEDFIRFYHRLTAETDRKMRIHIKKKMKKAEEVFFKLNQG